MTNDEKKKFATLSTPQDLNSDDTVRKDLTGLPPGVRMLGPYKILHEIGRGAMGTVFKAEHTSLKRLVAIKILPQDFAATDDRYQRFQREMEAIGRLQHPNIVMATDAGQIDGICFITMQLIDGIDLGQLLKQNGSLEIGAACEVIRQVALGLQEIGDHQMVHRDVKPSNLLLSKTGEIKILDLGIAALLGEPSIGYGAQGTTSGLTMTGSFVGTPDYVAPEQIINQGPLDIRADIYSLGCTLYHLLSGRAPYSGDQYKTFPAKLLGHTEHSPSSLDQLEPPIPKPLLQVLGRMLAKNRDERYSQPIEVANGLQPFCDAESLRNYFSGKPNRSSNNWAETPTPNKRFGPLAIITSLCMVALLAIGAMTGLLLAWQKSRPELTQNSPTQETTSDVPNDLKITNEQTEAHIGTQIENESSSPENESSSNSVAEMPKQDDASAPDAETTINGEESSQASQQPEAQSTNESDVPTVDNQAKPSADETSQAMVKSNEDIAENTEDIAKNTEKIALTLEQMQQQFEAMLNQINKEPSSPAEWYANAMQYAKQGNQLEARRAFLEFFSSELNVVDPYQSFATLLKLQEGSAGARETFQSLPGDATIPSRVLAEIHLRPFAERREHLAQLIESHPEFGPAYFALAKSIVPADTVQISLSDQLAVKNAASDYLQANEDGHVLKYYLDQTAVASTIDEANSLRDRFENATAEALAQPVKLAGFHPVDSEWWLQLEFAELVTNISYRLSDQDEFQSINVSGIPVSADDPALQTKVLGTRLILPRQSEKRVIEIRYRDVTSTARGPFEVEFDPASAEIAAAMKHVANEEFREDWVELGWEGEIGLTGLLILGRRAVKEVRLGINKETPDEVFPLPTEDYGPNSIKQYWTNTNKKIEFVTIQVTTIDGKQTPILRFEPER